MKSNCPVNNNLIHKKLRQYREDADLSQQMLAAKMQCLGIPLYQQGISRIERNVRYVLDYELLGFCSILRVAPDDLMSEE